MNFFETHKKALIAAAFILGLAVLVVVTNPREQMGKANDNQRKSAIGSLLTAMYEYQASPTSLGALPACLRGQPPVEVQIPICDPDKSGVGEGNGGFEGAIQLGRPSGENTYDCSLSLIPAYLSEIPVDPSEAFNEAETGYYICQQVVENEPRIYLISVGTEFFKQDGGCEVPGTTDPTMCVSA